MTREELYAQFDAYSKLLWEGLNKSHEQYDKTLTLISSGGLVLSMTFVEKIGGQNPSEIPSLIAAWFFLALTLLLSLISSLFSIFRYERIEKSWDNTVDHFYKLYPEGGLPDNTFNKLSQTAMNAHRSHYKLVVELNNKSGYSTWAPFLTLCLGVGSLLYFSSSNLFNGKTHVQERTTSIQAEPRYKRDTTTTTTQTAQPTQQPKEVKKEASN